MDLPKRKKIRLKGYDYSSCGAYFVTICVNGFKQILWNADENGGFIPQNGAQYVLPENNPTPKVGADIIRPTKNMRHKLTHYGEIIDTAIRQIPEHYPNIEIDKYCIMPNHIHMIVFIFDNENGRMISAPTLSTIIGQMKRWVSKQLGFSIWQKSFHDHIIRSEKGYQQIRQYIDLNPQTWQGDCFYNKENEVNEHGNEKNCELYG